MCDCYMHVEDIDNEHCMHTSIKNKEKKDIQTKLLIHKKLVVFKIDCSATTNVFVYSK